MDIYQTGGRIQNSLKRMEKLDKDVEGIRKFYNELRAGGFSEVRQSKLLLYRTILSEQLQKRGKRLVTATREDLVELVGLIEESDKSAWTKRDYKIALKKFYDSQGKRKLASWIKTSVRNNKRKLPGELLTEEEVNELIDAAQNSRDKALFALLADAGLRIGEALALRIKDVVFDEYGAYLLVPSGKTGARRVRLISSIQYLRNWLEVHPNRERESKLFVRVDKNAGKRQLMYSSVVSALKKALKRAGIEKRVHLHLFRHTAATRAAKFMTEQEMKVHFGWDAGSRMPAIYVHLSGADVEDKLLAHYGIKKNEKGEELMSTCPKCGKRNPKTAKFCLNCSCILDRKMLSEVDSVNAKVEIVKQKLLSSEEFGELIAGILSNA